MSRAAPPTRRAWSRFRQNRAALYSGLLLAGLIAAGIGTLPFSIAWHDHQSLAHVRHEPRWSNPVGWQPDVGQRLQQTAAGRFCRSCGPAVFRRGAVLGFDNLGRSLLYRCLLGGVISLGIGIVAAAIAVGVGVLWGAVSGLAGGRVDGVMMRIVDVLYGLPYILLVILLKMALDVPLRGLLRHAPLANIAILFLAIGATSWLTMARVIRGQVLSLRQQPFVEAARAYGAGPLRIVWRHLLPNLVGPVVIYGSLIVPQAILSESFLSFLGIGIQRPVPTWGALVAEGLQAVNSVVNFWWLIAFPATLLSVTLLALNFLGDGLRDAFDPRTAG